MSKARRHEALHFLLDSTLFSYGQLFFTQNRMAAALILLATFLRPEMGAWGLAGVLLTNGLALLWGQERHVVREGLFGMNSLLVLLGLALLYKTSATFVLIYVAACIVTLLLAIGLLHWLGQYGLPVLSAPFLLALWTILLAVRQYRALETGEGDIYLLNELFRLGGSGLVAFYEKIDHWQPPLPVSVYFKSLAAILFQGSILTGLFVAMALLWSSRISFTLSVVGFLTGYWFYRFVGADFTQLQYTNIGFNFILSAIALGGFFFIPSWKTYLLAVVSAPIAALLIAAGFATFGALQLPVYSLPFIGAVWLVLYSSFFQKNSPTRFVRPAIQQNSPEKNLYAYRNYLQRFSGAAHTRLSLPFFGEWHVSQGHDGAYTHLQEWGQAWDFEVRDNEGKAYREDGSLPGHYYAYNLPVLAPAAGYVVQLIDDVPDNPIGQVNLESNWGNAIVIKHADGIFSMLGHLKAGSFQVEEGAHVKKGDVLAHLGNSGRSPSPHIHFQLQATPYVGSKTMRYPLAHYLIKKTDSLELAANDIPKQGQTVFNIKPLAIMEKAFHFIPGQELHFRVEEPGGKQSDICWEMWTDAWNQSYLYAPKDQAMAYFINDGAQFYFTSFAGDRNSLLYKFYLGAFRLTLGHYKDLAIYDEIPLDQVVGGPLGLLQDFLAPFWLFQKASFQNRFTGIDNPTRPNRIELTSQAELAYFHRKKTLQTFRLTISDGKIQTWVASDGQRTWTATSKEKPLSDELA